MSKTEFTDDKLEFIESDIKKIQMKTGMYISYVGEKGALHLAKEAIQNAIDECENVNSPAKNITITLDLLEDSLTVEDDGRGIPEDSFPLDIVCTKLQSGSKFTREQGGKSSGENGVGLTAINALSDYFSLNTIRDGMSHRIEFHEGEKTNDTREKVKKKHGTLTKFSPSKKYLGKSAKISKNALIDWVDSISYFIPDDCKIVLNITKGLENIETKKFKARPIVELLKSKISDDMISPILDISASQSMKEEVRELSGKTKTVKRSLDVQVALVYTNSIEPYIDSYCNYINTISGGVHLDAVREAIWRFFMRKCNESMTDKEKEKYKILKVDVEQGMNIVVNLATDMQMQLVGQTKNAVGNDELTDPIKKLVTEWLDKYFTEHKDKLTIFTKLIKTNCKARLEASKVRSATIKVSKDKFDKFKYDKFTPCNNEGKEYKELHLCEGDSAANCLVDGRDPDTQAFYSFRGVTANAFKRNEITILDNSEWRTYVTLLKCGWGKTFDINKLYYDKIIMEADSDIDGYFIRSTIGAFHALFLPEIVKAGKLYTAFAPLYHLDDKNHPFARDKREYVELYQDKIIKNYKAGLTKLGKEVMDKGTFREFIFDTEDYPDELIRVSKYFGVNKFLIERIAAYLVYTGNDTCDMSDLFKNQKFVTELVEMVQKKYPEITLKNQSFRGVIDGRFQSIEINNRFIRKTEDLMKIYHKYGYTMFVKENGSDKFVQMSIGEFLDVTMKFKPKIKSRFKGLGEANSKQLWDTTLNPDNRILIQLTMEDVEKDLEVFAKLHGQTKEDLMNRKKMMSAFKIRRDDLDN